MIIQCESCSKKFIVKDSDIPQEGRNVQCGYCSVTWHQMPISAINETIKITKKSTSVQKINETLSIDAMKASDGKTYKFLGSQWAQVLPSGKTGLFAKKKIGSAGKNIPEGNFFIKKPLPPATSNTILFFEKKLLLNMLIILFFS